MRRALVLGAVSAADRPFNNFGITSLPKWPWLENKVSNSAWTPTGTLSSAPECPSGITSLEAEEDTRWIVILGGFPDHGTVIGYPDEKWPFFQVSMHVLPDQQSLQRCPHLHNTRMRLFEGFYPYPPFLPQQSWTSFNFPQSSSYMFSPYLATADLVISEVYVVPVSSMIYWIHKVDLRSAPVLGVTSTAGRPCDCRAHTPVPLFPKCAGPEISVQDPALHSRLQEFCPKLQSVHFGSRSLQLKVEASVDE